METITYQNINVPEVDFITITGLEILHKLNEHAYACVEGEMTVEKAEEYIKRVDEKQTVGIRTTADGQPGVLFVGIVENAEMIRKSEYAIVKINLVSTSRTLDYQKNNRSFQNTSMTYEQVMEQVVKKHANINVNVTDRPIGNMLVQCEETDWEFCKRLASMLSMPIITTIDAYVPTFMVGLSNSMKEFDVSETERYAASELKTGSSMLMEDRLGTSIATTQYVFLGSKISGGGRSNRVCSIHSTLESGVLITTVCVTTEKGFVQQTVKNNQIMGKMYTGVVKEVKRDTVRVHLIDIDESFDDGGNVWLPYSTAYSSSDGSGFYSMPAVGDQVRVFFPGSSEGEAFAASSVCVSPGSKVTDKKWTGPKGKQILMTEEGIFISNTNGGNKIFIDLVDEKGINISCDKDVSIYAKNNLSLISNNKVSITAENNILISSAEAYIDITPKKIELGADNIVIK